MKLLIAIPALNEEASIEEVINQIRLDLPDATPLVIDDGSKDRTAHIARECGAIVISMPFNVGVGGALRVAFKYAVANDFDYVLQIDADGQHLPSEAFQLLEKASSDSIVVGSRFRNPNGNYDVSGARKTAMVLLALITSKICKTKLTDVTSGFRLASGSAVKLFASDYPREYLGDTVESLIIAHNAGIPISEVSVNMRHREHGTPSQNLIKSSWYLFRALLMISLATIKKKSN